MGIQMCSRILSALAMDSGLLGEFGRHQSTHIHVQPGKADPHQNKGQKEIRDALAEKPEHCEHIIEDRILTRRRVDADGNGDDPGEDQRQRGQNEGDAQAPPNQIGHRSIPVKGLAEIAVEDDVGDPAPILQEDRVVQPELRPQDLFLLDRDEVPLIAHFGNHGGDVVARRKLNDDEGYERHRDEGRNCPQGAFEDVVEHSKSSANRIWKRYPKLPAVSAQFSARWSISILVWISGCLLRTCRQTGSRTRQPTVRTIRLCT